MLHLGLGETHINNLLAVINIPVIHQKTLKRREPETGRGIEKLMEKATAEALCEEVEKLKSDRFVHLFHILLFFLTIFNKNIILEWPFVAHY